MADEPVGRAEQEPYPPFVRTDEDRRRWELCTRAVAVIYGYQPGAKLDRWDRMVFWRGARTLFHDRSKATGEGWISEEERGALQAMGVL